jgi:hypothetical protein
MRWAVLEFRGIPPTPRYSAVGLAVGTHRRLWVFGGCTSRDSLPLNDVHTLDVSGPDEGGGGGGGGGGSSGGRGGDHDAAPASMSGSYPVELSGGNSTEARLRAKARRPPPRAQLQPEGQQLTMPLPTLALSPLPPLPNRRAEAELRFRGAQAVTLVAQHVSVERALRPQGEAAAIEAARQLTTQAAASGEPADAGTSGSTPLLPSKSNAAAGGEVPPGECTTVLVRRDGGYVLKVVPIE